MQNNYDKSFIIWNYSFILKDCHRSTVPARGCGGHVWPVFRFLFEAAVITAIRSSALVALEIKKPLQHTPHSSPKTNLWSPNSGTFAPPTLCTREQHWMSYLQSCITYPQLTPWSKKVATRTPKPQLYKIYNAMSHAMGTNWTVWSNELLSATERVLLHRQTTKCKNTHPICTPRRLAKSARIHRPT